MEDDVREIHWASYEQTAVEPMTMVCVVGAVMLTFWLPRRWAVLPMLLVATLIPYPQRVVLGGVGLDMVRLVVLSALARVLARSELQVLQLTLLDKAVLAWAVAGAIVPFLADPGHAAQSLGFVLDNVVEYLVIRALVLDDSGLKPLVRTFVLASVVVCAGMVMERKLGKNYFYLVGNHMEVWIREGEVRATASFDHAILAGTYGAMIFPLAWMLRSGGRGDKALWILGMTTSTVIVAASKSSGPLYGFAAGLFALSLWRFRRHVKTLRNLLWVTLIALHLVMTAPVWALLFRIPDALGLVAGSTSYHRFELIDLAIQHFWEWWLCGISLEGVARWAWGINDITNQFLFVGFSSGLLGLILFIRVLVRGFGTAGRCVRSADESGAAETCRNAWILGSLLFVHVLCFMGVCYSSGFWFFLNLSLALVSAGCAWPQPVQTPALVGAEGFLSSDGNLASGPLQEDVSQGSLEALASAPTAPDLGSPTDTSPRPGGVSN